MPALNASTLTQTIARQFVSKVDVADAAAVHALLQNTAVREAMPGALGDHAILNLSSRVPSVQKDLADTIKYGQDASVDRQFLMGWKAILQDLQGAGAKLTDGLKAFIAG